tara:strand:- start:2760 stop:3251 length:492 start_codon:yes stop_codon:yes gene_type:complete
MRYKEFDLHIKAVPEKGDEELLGQLIGNKGAKVTADTDVQTTQSQEPSENPGKVNSDDKNDQPAVFPLQQEIEMKKAELGKDSEAIANITQDQDEKGPKVDEEEPLIQEPETVDGGENPGVPQELKNSANKTEESEEEDKKTRKSGIAAGIRSSGIPKKFGAK